MVQLILALVLTFESMAPASARQQPSGSLELVEVVGCLTAAPGGNWILTRATDPVGTKNVWTTKEALKEAEVKPLGSQQYRLLGAGPFAPESYTGQKVAAKGVLIKDAKESRLNVTSLQSVAPTCTK